MTPTVSVVVLSYNRPDYLRESLASVAAQSLRPVEVIVVDNRSDRSAAVAAVAAEFPGVRLIAHPENRGFTGGMNAGLAAVAGEYVMLTEDDVVLAPDYLAQVVAVAEARPDAGIVAGVQLNRIDQTVRCAGGRYRLGGVYELELIRVDPPGGAAAVPYPVDFVPGSMILARTTFVRALGGFRAGFFMYGEDVELCARVTRAGRVVLVAPAARAEHFDPPAGPTPGWLEEMKLRNLIGLYVLHAPARVLPEFVVRYGVLGVARALATHPRRAWRVARAWGRAAAQLPGLVADRARLRWPARQGGAG